MKRGLRQAGFTIVEVMIVLAVTAALFVAIAATLSGRTASAEFNQAIQDTRVQIQQVLTEVQAGHYANLNNFSCKNAAGSVQISAIGPKEQGTNQGCVFLGKAIYFNVQPSSSGEQYVIYPIAGIQGTTDAPITKLPDADPTVIAPDDPGQQGTFPDDSLPITLKYGIKTQAIKLTDNNDVVTSIGAIAFVTSLGEEKTGDNPGYNPGAIQVNVYGLKGTSIDQGDDTFDAARKINAALQSTDAVSKLKSITICIQDAGGTNSGLITIGQKHSQLSVDMVIRSSGDCS